MEYKPEMAESDPKALFQQQIPKSFLDLQDAIRQAVAAYQQRGAVPIMQEEEFKWVAHWLGFGGAGISSSPAPFPLFPPPHSPLPLPHPPLPSFYPCTTHHIIPKASSEAVKDCSETLQFTPLTLSQCGIYMCLQDLAKFRASRNESLLMWN